MQLTLDAQDVSRASGRNVKRFITEVLSVLVAFFALVVSIFAYLESRDSNKLSGDANLTSNKAIEQNQGELYSVARSEVANNSVRMATLDQQDGRRNGDQIAALGLQSKIIIDRYGQANLNLSPAVYRVIAEKLALSTDEFTVAHSMAEDAVSLAEQQGGAGAIERIRAHRALADIAAQQLDLRLMQHEYNMARVTDSASKKLPDQATVNKSMRRTNAFALFSALLAAQEDSVEVEACAIARNYFRLSKEDHLSELLNASDLSVARRAQRVPLDHSCELSGLQLERWKRVWYSRNRTAGT